MYDVSMCEAKNQICELKSIISENLQTLADAYMQSKNAVNRMKPAFVTN
jgi:hypothetical protein